MDKLEEFKALLFKDKFEEVDGRQVCKSCGSNRHETLCQIKRDCTDIVVSCLDCFKAVHGAYFHKYELGGFMGHRDVTPLVNLQQERI